MMSRRTACLVAFALVLGATWRRWPGTELASAAAPRAQTVASRPGSVSAAIVRAEVRPKPAAVVAPPCAPVTTLSADDSALLAEQIVLQQRLGAAGLQLSPEQWTAFAAISLHYQAVRHAFEATIASAAAAGEGRVRMEIPAYPAAGDALRTRFFTELREKLGAGIVAEIARQAAPAIEGHFGGFGVSVQTLEFVREPGGTDADYYVTRTVNYWNAATAQADSPDRLTTRREVHFPGLEDPSGHSWGPFLSVLATPASAKAGS